MALVMSHILTLLQGFRGPLYCHQEVLFKLENVALGIYHNGHSGFHVGAILSNAIEVFNIYFNIWPYLCLRISKT